MPSTNGARLTLASATTRGGAKRHGLRAVIFLVVALVAAGGSALLLTRYTERRLAASRVETVKVVVADVDLPIGSEIRAENLRLVDWPKASRPETAFATLEEVSGKVVAARIFKQEPVLTARLAGGAGSGLSAILAPGTRAAAVRVDDVVGVAGFIHPGDSVDVIVTIRADAGQGITSSKVILQNIRVLAVGKELDHRAKGQEKVVPATVATLQVDAEQSERLALAATQGKLLLTLRSAVDTETVATSGMTAAALLALPNSGARPATRVARAAPPPPQKEERAVEILRGELFERRRFAGDGK